MNTIIKAAVVKCQLILARLWKKYLHPDPVPSKGTISLYTNWAPVEAEIDLDAAWKISDFGLTKVAKKVAGRSHHGLLNFDNQFKGVSIEAVVDTGASHSLISASLAAQLGINEKTKSSKFQSQGRMFNVDGNLNGVYVEANADTGASFNVISKAFANVLDLAPEPGTKGYISLPSGKRIFSPGRVKGSFQFGSEEKKHELSCIILEKVSHALVLGSKFLRLTKTFKKHMNRLKRVFSSVSRFSFNLLGDEQEVIPGYLNGSSCYAVPDSGSDIMVVSGKYARAHGLKVHRRRRHRHRVEFIDGSRTLTDGIVKNLSWQFREGEEPIRCDFHVIDKLPVDAILSNAMIDEHNVFTEYDDLFVQVDLIEDQSGIYNIRLAEECREEIAQLEDTFVQDSKYSQASSYNKLTS